jgi:hypothetical protein
VGDDFVRRNRSLRFLNQTAVILRLMPRRHMQAKPLVPTVDSADWSTTGEFVPSDLCIDAIASLLLDLTEAESSDEIEPLK